MLIFQTGVRGLVFTATTKLKTRATALSLLADEISAAEPVVITFVTGNLRKLEEAQMIIDSSCNIPFKLQARGDFDLDELQSDNPEKVAAAKCRLAATVVGGPVIIDDTSLCFEALGGMPGPYIKWFMDSCGCDGLVKMLNGFDNRRAFAQCSIAFSPGPGSEPCIFTGRTTGNIVTKYCEETAAKMGGFGWDAIFVPGSDISDSTTACDDGIPNTLTFAEMSTEAKNAVSHRGRALRQFSVFLQENQDWVTGRAILRKADPVPPESNDSVFSFRRRRRMV